MRQPLHQLWTCHRRKRGSSAESVSENQLANDSEVTKHGVSNANADDESHHRFQNGFFEA